MSKFAISDIHGCSRTFNALLDKIAFSQADELFLLGDYIDRGPDSRGVIDTIFKLRESGYRIHCLRGNHEQMLLDVLENTYSRFHWYANGGVRTLESFEKMEAEAIGPGYIDFFSKLDFYFAIDNFLLVHAGLNFNHPSPLSDTVAMLWVRNWYERIDYQWLGERIIIHGHTPISEKEIRQQWKQLDERRYLNIDGGCVFAGVRQGLGSLCAYDLTNNRLFFQESLGEAFTPA